ncbi:MAG TPA: hypothetical protein VL137_13510, partial [Polyangiaceae bacterium]|nr:hypothetical protein [Polyangiaceae bacterium]
LPSTSCALAPLAVKAGGLGLNEVRALQGAEPWHWAAFDSLSGACAALLFLLTMLFDASGAQGSGALGSASRWHHAQTTASFCDGLLVALKCVLFATLFLGLGVPASGLPAAGRIAALLPVCVDLAKYALVVLLVTRLQSKLHFPRLEDLAWPIVIASLCAATLTGLLLGQGKWQQAPLMEWVDQGVAPALCLAGAIGVLFALMGKRWNKLETPRSVAINPWL